MNWRCILFAIGLMPMSMALHAREPDYPVFVAQISNPNDYTLFANSGWDGNWYVGYNNGWIKKLPPIPKGNYAHAFVGAKMGRMKLLLPVGKPPEFNPIPGEIWMAMASTPAWSAANRVKLTTTEDIPLESSSEYALENAGEAQWFWKEIPLESVNLSGDNYLALWSPTPTLLSVSSSPVLAAAWGGKDINSWVAKDIKGEPPVDPKAALATGISVFQPALALKLVPAGPARSLRARVVSWHNGTPDHLKPILAGSVEGESVERVWVEYDRPNRSGDVIRGEWIQVGRSLWKAPYVFTLDQAKLPQGKLLLRIAASNVWGDKAYSDPLEIEVSPLRAKTK